MSRVLDLGPADLDPDYEWALEVAAANGASPADVDTARAGLARLDVPLVRLHGQAKLTVLRALCRVYEAFVTAPALVLTPEERAGEMARIAGPAAVLEREERRLRARAAAAE